MVIRAKPVAQVEVSHRHNGADLLISDAKRNISTPEDLADIAQRHSRFIAMKEYGVMGQQEALADSRKQRAGEFTFGFQRGRFDERRNQEWSLAQ